MVEGWCFLPLNCLVLWDVLLYERGLGHQELLAFPIVHNFLPGSHLSSSLPLAGKTFYSYIINITVCRSSYTWKKENSNETVGFVSSSAIQPTKATYLLCATHCAGAEKMSKTWDFI